MRRAGTSERGRQTAAIAVIIAVILSASLFAAKNIKIAQSHSRPAMMPSDDEIYTGSILFVPDDETICCQFLFDNRTGRLTDNGLVECERAHNEDISGRAMQWSSVRAKVISESFRGWR